MRFLRGALILICSLGWACDDGGATADPDGGAGGMGGVGGVGGGGAAGGMGGGLEPDVGAPCADGMLTCGGACVDQRTDPAHCGDCATQCSDGEACVDGACQAPDPCARPPLAECDASDDDQPPRLNEHAAAYDDERGTMIIFGGNTAVPENCGFPAYTFQSVTWIYYDFDTGCGRWKRIDDGNPPGRARHAAAWGDGAMWVHGGRFRAAERGNYQVFDDLWRFDPETRAWTEVATEGPTPPGRFNHTLVHDAGRNQLLLYGGNVSGNAVGPQVVDDVWRFDIATRTWSEIEVLGRGPTPRMWHAAFYDNVRDQMVVYGGGDETAFNLDARYFTDLAAFFPESGRWGQLHDGRRGTRPDGRFWGQMVHETATDTYLLFAGHDDQSTGNRNDTWAFDVDAMEWGPLTDEDTFNRDANGFCDFPPDFTNVVPGTPERRNAHTLVYSQTCGHALTFGGKTDCGATNDVWTFGADGWSNPVMATEGESCLRWRANPDNCANLCF